MKEYCMTCYQERGYCHCRKRRGAALAVMGLLVALLLTLQAVLCGCGGLPQKAVAALDTAQKKLAGAQVVLPLLRGVCETTARACTTYPCQPLLNCQQAERTLYDVLIAGQQLVQALAGLGVK